MQTADDAPKQCLLLFQEDIHLNPIRKCAFVAKGLRFGFLEFSKTREAWPYPFNPPSSIPNFTCNSFNSSKFISRRKTYAEWRSSLSYLFFHTLQYPWSRSRHFVFLVFTSVSSAPASLLRRLLFNLILGGKNGRVRWLQSFRRSNVFGGKDKRGSVGSFPIPRRTCGRNGWPYLR